MAKCSTYNHLVTVIAEEMETMKPSDARAMASEITLQINDTLNNGLISKGEYQPSVNRIEKLVPPNLRNSISLSAAWEAYNRAHGVNSRSNQSTEEIEVICTLPLQFRDNEKMRVAGRNTGIWPGSLISTIYELFEVVSNELIIVSPYWSTSGTTVLLRHITRSRLDGVEVNVITQPACKHSDDARKALQILKEYLLKKGAKVGIYCPFSADENFPLIHAKAIVCDGLEAYLGSANISFNGIEQNVELGVRLCGPHAQSIRDWLHAIFLQLDKW
jgi:phosphatidylserine/phosphatidylglycerophosphate/cardiolipin synthase-like enzyme